MSVLSKLPILDLATELYIIADNRNKKDNNIISAETYIANDRYSLINLAIIGVKTASLISGVYFFNNHEFTTPLQSGIIASLGAAYALTQLAHFKKDSLFKKDALQTKFIQNLILENFSQSNFNDFNNMAVESNHKFSNLMSGLFTGNIVDRTAGKAIEFISKFKGYLTDLGLKTFETANDFANKKLNQKSFILESIIDTMSDSLFKNTTNKLRIDFLKDSADLNSEMNKKYLKDYTNISNKERSSVENVQREQLKKVNDEAITAAYEAVTKQNIKLLFARTIQDNANGNDNTLLLEYFSKLNSYTKRDYSKEVIPPLPHDPRLFDMYISDEDEKQHKKALNERNKTMNKIDEEYNQYEKISNIAQEVLNGSYKGNTDFRAILKEIAPEMATAKNIKVFSFSSAFNAAKESIFKRALGLESKSTNTSLVNPKRVVLDEIEYKNADLDQIAKVENNPSLKKHLAKENKRTA